MNGTVSETIAGEGSLLLTSFLFGIALMAVYDALRIFRHIFKHGTFLMALEDVIYWFICAIGIFAMLYQENDGLLRWFVLGGAALGMLIENAWISPWIVQVFVKVIRIFIKVIRRVLRTAGAPAKKTCVFFRKELKKIRKAIKIGMSKE